MARIDYYEVLQVEKSATDDELKKAYRRLAVQFHPDRNPGNKEAEESFKQINEAYQILSDPKRRSAYDQFGHAGLGQGGFEGGFGGGSFTDIFDNIFGEIFGQGAGRQEGVDLQYEMNLSFEEAALGAEKKITFDRETPCTYCGGSGAKAGSQPKACRTCRGSGQVRFNQGFFTLSRTCSACNGKGAVVEDPCGECKGRGRKRKSQTVTVKVPAGVNSGQRLRLRGEGEVGDSGSLAGDLYVHFQIEEHPLFKRQDEHVILELPITFVQAALGAEIEVPTLHGMTKLKLSPGTQSGDLKRIKGKGIVRLNGSGMGDQVVQILVETPTHLSAKQKNLLEEFDREGREKSYPTLNQFLTKLQELFKK